MIARQKGNRNNVIAVYVCMHMISPLHWPTNEEKECYSTLPRQH